MDTSPVVEFVPSLTVYCTGTTPVNVALGAVYVKEPVAGIEVTDRAVAGRDDRRWRM